MTTQRIEAPSFSWANRVGFFAALFSTGAGLLYFIALLAAISTGGSVYPPAQGLQLLGGVVTFIVCPALVLLMTAVHTLTPPSKKVFSQAALGFTLLFALAVSINRFSQLGVVRQAALAGQDEGISWFLAYGDHSILLGLEYLGWTWFLGLAMFCAAPLFSDGRLQKWIRGLMILYGALGLAASLGFLMGTWLSVLGFVAWGGVLAVITGLMIFYFR